jgi:hypothetical protein
VYFEMLQMVRLYEQQSKKHDGTYLVTLAFFSCASRGRCQRSASAPEDTVLARPPALTRNRAGQRGLEEDMVSLHWRLGNVPRIRESGTAEF